MTSLPGVSFPLEPAGVNHRHHGRHDDQLARRQLPAVIASTTGTVARCQVYDQRRSSTDRPLRAGAENAIVSRLRPDAGIL
jgi:hypothetical protein